MTIFDRNQFMGRLWVDDMAGTGNVVNERTFRRSIAIERKRTERSGCPFLLMLVDGVSYQAKNRKGLGAVMAPLLLTTRETDVIGWYKDWVTVGGIFTGLGINDKNLILGAILTRVDKTLRENLTREQFDRVSILFHFFPDDWDGNIPQQAADSVFYPELSTHRRVVHEARPNISQ